MATTYNVYEFDIAGIEGNMQAQARVFAHSAKAITIPSGAATSVDVLVSDTVPDPLPAGDTVQTHKVNRGACLYIGQQGDVKVLLEGDEAPVVFKSVSAGSFLPIMATKIYGSGTGGTTAQSILALF